MNAREEGSLLARYILGESAGENVLSLYERAVHVRGLTGDSTAEFALRHRWALGFVDAYLARFQPAAPLRRKLYLMSAILETQPRFADKFLPVERPAYYVVAVSYFAARALLKLAAGCFLAPFIR